MKSNVYPIATKKRIGNILLFFNYLAIGCLFEGCDLFEYHPYEGRIDGDVHLTEYNLNALESKELGDQYKFAFISDTQRHYDETDDAVKSINEQGNIDFVLHGGDLTDFGVTDEFEWMRDCLQKLEMPWLTVLGNHDFLGHGEHIYYDIFGEFNYAFTVGRVRFLMINTVALELDYSTPVPDFDFLEKQSRHIAEINAQYPDSLLRTILVMHSRPFDEQFNNNVVLPFDRYLNLFPNPICLYGHNHKIEVLDTFGDGILFYGVSDIKKRRYLVFTISDEEYEVEQIDF